MNIIDIMQDGPVIPVLTIDSVEQGVAMARALVAGGIRVLECTLRTAAGMDAAAAIARQVPGAIVGVGTVTRPEEFRQAMDIGAVFAVSPGLTPLLAEGAHAAGMNYLPGVMTPAEVIFAKESGFSNLKLFPATVAGGIPMLKALHAPFPDVFFCPTGGVSQESARDFLALPNVRCLGGSWVVPPAAVAAGDWGKVEQLARATVQALKRN